MKIVGVDIGGTSVKSALIEYGDSRNPSTYEILERASVKTEGRSNAEKIIGNICAAIEKFINKSDAGIIGIGSAGDIDDRDGSVTYATDSLAGFTGLKLREIISAKFGIPAVVVNDANAALIGETYVGGLDCNRPMMITLGTGLGCAVIEDRTAPLASGSVRNIRLGHVTLYEGGRLCSCSKKGCAEQYVSATALKLNAGVDDAEEVLKNAEYSEAADKFVKDFAKIVKIAVDTYSPDKIIVGGGVVELAEYWWDKAVTECKEYGSYLHRAKLGNRAALLGGAYAALEGKFGLQNGKY